MKNLLESLQDVLLVFSIILLVYVLYNRLLVVMGKDKKKKNFAVIGEKLEWSNDREAILNINLPSKMSVGTQVFNHNHVAVNSQSTSDFEMGEHRINVDCSQCQPGRYYLKVNTPGQESSLYFDLK